MKGLALAAIACLWGSAYASQANAEMRAREVFAICHYSVEDSVQNDIFRFFIDTREVWFGAVYSGIREAGRIVFVSDQLIAAEVSVSVEPITVFYLASVLIDVKDGRYFKSEIRQRDCETYASCEYETNAFEGECHRIEMDFEP